MPLPGHWSVMKDDRPGVQMYYLVNDDSDEVRRIGDQTAYDAWVQQIDTMGGTPLTDADLDSVGELTPVELP